MEVIPIPWTLFINGGAVGILAGVFLMVMYGKLATPGHLKVLTDQLTYLKQVVKDQQDAIRVLARNGQVMEQVGEVVEHTMTTIKEKAGDR